MREENSSSPRGNSIEKFSVVKVDRKKRGAVRGKYEVLLSDGFSIFLLEKVVFKYAIFEDSLFSHEELLEIERESDYEECVDKAFDLLSHSEHSVSSLRLKLLNRGFMSESVERAINRMKELDYLNDERFAKNWIESRLIRHPEGKLALTSGLLNRGIDRAIAERAVESLVSEEVELQAAERVYEKLIEGFKRWKMAIGNGGIQKGMEKFYNRLAKYGFSPSITRKLMDRFREEMENENLNFFN